MLLIVVRSFFGSNEELKKNQHAIKKSKLGFQHRQNSVSTILSNFTNIIK